MSASLDLGALQATGGGVDLGVLQAAGSSALTIDGSNKNVLAVTATALHAGASLTSGLFIAGANRSVPEVAAVALHTGGDVAILVFIDGSNTNVSQVTAVALHSGAVIFHLVGHAIAGAGHRVPVVTARALSTGASMITPGLARTKARTGFWWWYGPADLARQLIGQGMKEPDEF